VRYRPLNNPVILLVVFMLLQLGGQIAAGLSGSTGSIVNLFTVISYCCLLARGIVWVLVLKKLPLTVAYPFTGAVYLLILPLSVLVFGEQPGWSRFAGAALIFAGVAVTAAGMVRNEH